MYGDLLYILENVKANKPNDKSALDRHYAVFITEFEKLMAYWMYYIDKGKELDND